MPNPTASELLHQEQLHHKTQVAGTIELPSYQNDNSHMDTYEESTSCLDNKPCGSCCLRSTSPYSSLQDSYKA